MPGTKKKQVYISKAIKEEAANKKDPNKVESRGFVFTLSNYNDPCKRDFNKCTRYEKLKKLKVGPTEYLSYIAFQSEKCPTTGTPHLQGFLYFNKKKRFNTALEIIAISEIHLEIMNGNFSQNNIYCSKGVDKSYDEKAGIRVELGTRPVGQGSRTDLIKFIEEGKNNGLIGAAEKYEIEFIKYGQGLHRLLNTIDKRRDRNKNMEVIVYIGKAGTNKTRSVFEAYTDDNVIYEPRYANGKVWFDGYDPIKHKCLLFNDFSGEIHLETFLKIIDRYGYAGEIKGSIINIKVDKIYITAQKEPKQWYPEASPEHMAALCRRLTEITLFNKGEKIDITENYKIEMEDKADKDNKYDELAAKYGKNKKKTGKTKKEEIINNDPEIDKIETDVGIKQKSIYMF